LPRALAAAVGDKAFGRWFQDKTSLAIRDDELTIGVASPFLADWFHKKFRAQLLTVARGELGPSAHVRFEVDANIASQQINAQPGESAGSTPPKPVEASKTETVKSVKRRRGRRFADLCDFVRGPENEMAYIAAERVCESSEAGLNPLVLCGGVGTGKTHLLEGIYRRIRSEHRELQVVYLTAEAFANYFTEALRAHTLPSFRQRFRTVDVLLIDDLDFLEGKRGIQQEFLHTFQQLVSHGGQVVVATSKSPRLSTELSEELRTRLLSGMFCRLEAPDIATRKAIVRAKAARLSGQYTEEALDFVAERFRNNIREIEGALNCLQTFYCMTQKRVGLPAARQVLSDLERDCLRVIRMADVEEAVCHLFGVESQDLKSSKRGRSVSQPRMLAMYLTRKHTQAAYAEIGGYFGGRNHSTVISAEKKVDDMVNNSTSIRVAGASWRVQDVLETLEQQLRVS